MSIITRGWVEAIKIKDVFRRRTVVRDLLTQATSLKVKRGPGARRAHCRVDGRFSSVFHAHDYADRCRADLTRRVYALPATRRTTERRGACLRWRSEHAVTPDMSWGTLPAVLQEKWTAYDCDHLVQDAIQREDEEARARTVRRGWNRTAGSRYAFAADGVTFESSGGI